MSCLGKSSRSLSASCYYCFILLPLKNTLYCGIWKVLYKIKTFFWHSSVKQIHINWLSVWVHITITDLFPFNVPALLHRYKLLNWAWIKLLPSFRVDNRVRATLMLPVCEVSRHSSPLWFCFSPTSPHTYMHISPLSRALPHHWFCFLEADAFNHFISRH